MTNTNTLNRGDKVRVTFEGTVTNTVDGKARVATPNGWVHVLRHPEDYKVEVLEPARQAFKPGDIIRHTMDGVPVLAVLPDKAVMVLAPVSPHSLDQVGLDQVGATLENDAAWFDTYINTGFYEKVDIDLEVIR